MWQGELIKAVPGCTGAGKGKLHSFLTFTSGGNEWSATCCSHCTHWERTLGTGWAPQPVWKLWKNRKICSTGKWNADCPACCKVTVSTDCGILSACTDSSQCFGTLACCSTGKLRDKGCEESGHAIRATTSITDCTLVYVIHRSVDLGGFDMLLDSHHKKAQSVSLQYERVTAHKHCAVTEHIPVLHTVRTCPALLLNIPISECACAMHCYWALLSHREANIKSVYCFWYKARSKSSSFPTYRAGGDLCIVCFTSYQLVLLLLNQVAFIISVF